jgi:hypothetical protein
MPKIPDFSKFDFQNIVNSVKSIINPESSILKGAESDPIGAKILNINTLLKDVANAHAKSAKDLAQINHLLNELYRDLESFRKLEAEFRQKQHAEQAQATATGTTATPGTGASSQETATPSTPLAEEAPKPKIEEVSTPKTEEMPPKDLNLEESSSKKPKD